MEALAFVVPAVATVALGGALLVPIRDGRAGRKATLDGRSPLLADFRNVRVSEEAGTPEEPRTPSISHAPIEQAADAVPAALQPAFGAITMLRAVGKRLRTRAPEPDLRTEDDAVTERSFADELSSLLPPTAIERAPSIVHLPDLSAPPAIVEIPDETGVEIVERPLDVRAVHLDVNAVPLDAAAIPPAGARVVPLTRLPLRRQSAGVTWPASATPPRSFATASERYAFLRAAATDSEHADDALFARAFREETSEGRSLALAALRRCDASKEAIETFAEALVTGSDEERAIAVDALSEAGAREQIARGVTDRIDAIAAAAALAYVGTTARDDYRVALSPLIDESRIEAILALLAGVVE